MNEQDFSLMILLSIWGKFSVAKRLISTCVDAVLESNPQRLNSTSAALDTHRLKLILWSCESNQKFNKSYKRKILNQCLYQK